MDDKRLENFSRELNTRAVEFARLFSFQDKREKACYNMTMTQIIAILSFQENEKLSMNEISRRMGLTTSTMTRVIDILVRDGHIDRSRDEDDRRNVNIELTQKGREMWKMLKECEVNYFKAIAKDLPEEKWDSILDSLNILIRAFKKYFQACCI